MLVDKEYVLKGAESYLLLPHRSWGWFLSSGTPVLCDQTLQPLKTRNTRTFVFNLLHINNVISLIETCMEHAPCFILRRYGWCDTVTAKCTCCSHKCFDWFSIAVSDGCALNHYCLSLSFIHAFPLFLSFTTQPLSFRQIPTILCRHVPTCKKHAHDEGLSIETLLSINLLNLQTDQPASSLAESELVYGGTDILDGGSITDVMTNWRREQYAKNSGKNNGNTSLFFSQINPHKEHEQRY